MLTPPDWYTEHMAMRGARPMVVPWKDMPLQDGRREGDWSGDREWVAITAFPGPADIPRSFPRGQIPLL